MNQKDIKKIKDYRNREKNQVIKGENDEKQF
jgi:hypothetical protein